MKTILLAALIAGGLAAAEKDNYERSRECAAAAEKFAGDELQQSHYSPKYQRCFALTLSRHDTEGTPHGRSWVLWDVFEHNILADIEQSDKDEECGVLEDPNGYNQPCFVVRAYIDEHLKN